MTFIFEESEAVAVQLLEKCNTHLKKGLKKDPSKSEMLEQMVGAWEQRAEIQAASQRFAGKSQEEQALEYVKVVIVCCSVLQCVAVCCSVLQCVAYVKVRGLLASR